MRAALLATVSASRSKNLENNNLNNLNDSNVATPTRRPPTRPPARSPLQSRDGNAMMRVPPKAPLASKPGNANSKMPFDKQQRPIMPTLSASAKTSNRAPLTPRVAGATPSSATTTPLSRRTIRPDNNTPITASREDIYLSNNITPRSGSRKSRVDSPNNGTALDYASPNEPRVAQSGPVYNGALNVNGIDKDIPKRPTVSFSPALSEVGTSRVQSQNAPPESKFFFASDAKTVTQPSRPPLQSKASSSTFLYANGEVAPLTQASTTPAGSVVGEERAQPKFFHANGTPDLPPANYPPRPSSVLSSSSRASPRVGTASPGPISPLQRPASPSKLNQYASISSLRSTPSLPSPVLPRPQPTGRGQSANSIVANRRTSFEGQRMTSHGRSSSLGSTDVKVLPARKISGGSQVELSAPNSPPNQILKGLPVSTPEEVTQEEDNDDTNSGLRSPIKTGKTLEELNELAANARRERKVLDLEITNSSLEAINRTLEREMRKQTAELRRYRRLSRSGRLSINTVASSRISTDTLSIMDGEAGTMLSDMSEEEDEDPEDESEFSEEEFSDEASLSPSAMAESDARHRKRDEKRLQLDLSKHQQLLIDSQKMNQSLKRCLGWTEVLINEGKKALEYHVKVSDVELGGRVLALDEIEERQREQENEGMSEIGAQMLREARERQAAVAKQINDDLNAAAAWGGEGRDDRDSGIELDTSQREQYAELQ
ncbi:uncharacterized protein LY89DRAFT_683666 [Mollisia scopiformis]|uniref:Uncharacterized protein n=1 Tax=Mollisia scopiformis TaxID=149040 RepID=A0A194XF67_MOLSC|nr:uncharacterized protein LY89DRAFT_683666 [Mollisia scopiformis]KUJ18791.1 hypothetical protein LY89DRAFT_683666 [Mollisia scopiformis]